jgi:S-methylmethionine-dependent homocysteine/selenocysteine methylase
MSVERLAKRLNAGEIVVIDGGMGSELEARGVPMDEGGAWSAMANVNQFDIVRDIHEDYIRAGAELLIANTFSAGRLTLTAAGHGDHVTEVNQRGVQAALEARGRLEADHVVVAGSVSRAAIVDHLGRPHPPVSGFDVRGVLAEQAAMLVDAGAELLVLEVMDLPDEAAIALEEAAATGVPVWGGVSYFPQNRDAPAAQADPSFLAAVRALAQPQLSSMLVMHTDVRDAPAALELVREHWSGVLGVYPHVGTFEAPSWVPESIEPEAFAAQGDEWIARGATIIGGCCGLGPDHIRALTGRFGGAV